MGDLVEFLTARLAEIEQTAKDARGWQTGSRYEGQPLAWVQHSEIHSPARVLRDVEAKRRIIDALEQADPRTLPWAGLRIAVAMLALPYADHEDFKDEWRV